MSDAYAQEQATTWPAIRLGLHGAIAVLGLLLWAFLVIGLRANGQSASSWILVGVIALLLVIQVTLTFANGKKEVTNDEDEESAWGESFDEPESPYAALDDEATNHGWQEVDAQDDAGRATST